MPVPIMFDTTSAVALKTPSCRRREGLEVATSMFILRRVLTCRANYSAP